MWRALRSPACHFVLIGAALFGLASLTSPASSDRRDRNDDVIVLADTDIERRCDEWVRHHGTTPDGAAMQTLVDTTIEEEVLYREALARGFDRSDPVIRGLLVRLGRWLDLAPRGDDQAVEEQARDLGLEQTDAIVRRHLVHMMRLAAAKTVPADHPTEAEAQRYYVDHADRFMDSPRVWLTHVYLSADRRADAGDDARRVLDRLRHDNVDPRGTRGWGDPFIRGAHIAAAAQPDLERIFGPAFAVTVERLPLRTWSEPIRSTYGFHLVWVADRVTAERRPLETVRSQVVHGLLAERSVQRLRAAMRQLRDRYRIEPPSSEWADLAACADSPTVARRP